MEIFFSVVEFMGVAVFAMSGAMIAIDKEADLVGVILMALVTTFGGGITRDLLLGIHPPKFFTSYSTLVIIALCSSVLTFILASLFKRRYVENEKKIETIINVVDAMGLGIFSVYSALIAIENGHTAPFVAISMGVIGAVVGGVVRDLMLGNIPFIIKKRIYFLACLAGASVFYVLAVTFKFDIMWSTFAGFIATFTLRMCATIFKWNMPKAINFAKLNAGTDGANNK